MNTLHLFIIPSTFLAVGFSMFFSMSSKSIRSSARIPKSSTISYPPLVNSDFEKLSNIEFGKVKKIITFSIGLLFVITLLISIVFLLITEVMFRDLIICFIIQIIFALLWHIPIYKKLRRISNPVDKYNS